MTSNEIRNSLNNPATSFWLKTAVKEMDKRDIVDALRDVNILKLYLEARLTE